MLESLVAGGLEESTHGGPFTLLDQLCVKHFAFEVCKQRVFHGIIQRLVAHFEGDKAAFQ